MSLDSSSTIVNDVIEAAVNAIDVPDFSGVIYHLVKNGCVHKLHSYLSGDWVISHYSGLGATFSLASVELHGIVFNNVVTFKAEGKTELIAGINSTGLDVYKAAFEWADAQ